MLLQTTCRKRHNILWCWSGSKHSVFLGCRHSVYFDEAVVTHWLLQSTLMLDFPQLDPSYILEFYLKFATTLSFCVDNAKYFEHSCQFTTSELFCLNLMFFYFRILSYNRLQCIQPNTFANLKNLRILWVKFKMICNYFSYLGFQRYVNALTLF